MLKQVTIEVISGWIPMVKRELEEIQNGTRSIDETDLFGIIELLEEIEEEL